ncbi:MAG: hypothetical protein ACLR1T_11635 [Evtepia gabavorous]
MAYSASILTRAEARLKQSPAGPPAGPGPPPGGDLPGPAPHRGD